MIEQEIVQNGLKTNSSVIQGLAIKIYISKSIIACSSHLYLKRMHFILYK